MFGTAVGVCAAVNLDLINQILPNITASGETATLFVLGGIVGSVLPDIDNPVSYVGKLCSHISEIIGKIHTLQGKEEWRHRGVMHDAAIYLVGLILCYFYFSPLVGFFLGCLTHIFLDMFNPAGVPLLFGVKKLRFAKIKSGDTKSTVVAVVFTIITIALGVGLKVLNIKEII